MHKLMAETVDNGPETLQKRRKTDRKNRVPDVQPIKETPTEEQIDKTLKDSFPASDPPGSY